MARASPQASVCGAPVPSSDFGGRGSRKLGGDIFPVHLPAHKLWSSIAIASNRIAPYRSVSLKSSRERRSSKKRAPPPAAISSGQPSFSTPTFLFFLFSSSFSCHVCILRTVFLFRFSVSCAWACERIENPSDENSSRRRGQQPMSARR